MKACLVQVGFRAQAIKEVSDTAERNSLCLWMETSDTSWAAKANNGPQDSHPG